MKIFGLMAAALLGVGVIVPVQASAQPTVAHVTNRHVVVREHTVTRSGPAWHGNRWSTRRVCENRWRNGHRVRVCRTVRYRR